MELVLRKGKRQSMFWMKLNYKKFKFNRGGNENDKMENL